MKMTLGMRSILDVFEEGILLIDEADCVRCVNATAEQLLGYTEEELSGAPLKSIEIASSKNTRVPDADSAVTSGIESWTPIEFLRKDARVFKALCSRWPLEASEAGSMLMKFRGLDPHGSEDDARRMIRNKLDAVFDPVPESVVVITESGDIQLFNGGAEELFGYRREEMLNQNLKMLMSTPYREDDGYLTAFRANGVRKINRIEWEISGQRKNGSIFPMCLSFGEIWLDEHRFFVGVVHDLTKLKLAEERLSTLTAAIDQNPSAVFIADKEGRIDYVNPRVTQLTGFGSLQFVGRDLLLCSHNMAFDQLRLLRETLKAGRIWQGEIFNRTKGGDLYWALETISPLRDSRGEITHYLSILQDITEQKRNKQALVESEERFRHVAEMAGEWLWEQDPEGRYIYSSGAVQSILGFLPEEIIGKSYLDLREEDGNDRGVQTMAHDSSVSCQPFKCLVNRYRHKDGRHIYTESTGAPIFGEGGRLLKSRGVDHDITARKAYMDALRLRDRAIESVHVGIVISDAQNENIYVNPALCQMTGYTRDELLGRSMSLLQGPETDLDSVRQIGEALHNGEDCEVTLKNYRKDGKVFWNELMISPVVDDAGKITHYIGVQSDVTGRRQAEENRRELEIAREIQLSLLPEGPLRLPELEVAGICVPANHVGGDYFDFFEESGLLELVIADVSGHSVGAGLIMTEVRSMLRAEARKSALIPAGPAQVLRELNELLYNDLNRADLFMTMFHLQFEPASRSLKYANAGHNSALLLREGDSGCVRLDADGLVIGVLEEVVFEEKSLELSSGDKLVLYTDGVVETQNQRGDAFELDRLCVLLSACRRLKPEALVERVLDEVRAFAGSAPQRDDITIAIMEVK